MLYSYNNDNTQSDFKTDNQYGISGQQVIAAFLLHEQNFSGIQFMQGKFPYYDLKGIVNNVERTVEVKTHRKQTGNVFIELSKRTTWGGECGLNITTADKWCDFVPYRSRAYFSEPNLLREWIVLNSGVNPLLQFKQFCGDNYSVQGFTYPISEFEKLPFVKSKVINSGYYFNQ